MKKVLALSILGILLAAPQVRAQDTSCQNYFGRFSAATPHEALNNSAYYLEYSKLGSVFLVQQEGVPFYPPHWRFGLFIHSYSPVTLTRGGSLQASPGSFSTFRRGDLLAVAETKVTPFEARIKLISYDKFVIKPDSDKKTDRVTLEMVIPSEGNWCTAKRNFETWLKGFGGMLEMERYQKAGQAPVAVPVTEAPPPKKEKKAKVEEETPSTAFRPEPAPAPVPAPELKSKKEASAPAPQPKPAASGSKEISFKTGMSRSEVDSQLGAPVQVMKLGGKSICYYDDVIIEYENDKLTSIRLSDKPSGEVLKRFH